MQIISRKDARAAGLKLFFTGRECKNGHKEQRRVSNSNCLLCEKMQNKRYYDSNPDFHRKRSAEWRENNPEKYAQQHENKRLKRKEMAALKPKREKMCPKERERNRYIRDKEKRLAQSKAYYEKNKEKIKKYRVKWASENIEKVKAARWRRKARLKGAAGSFSSRDIEALMEKQKGRCVECRSCIKERFDIDHIMPLFLGGSNYPKNLQLLCRVCNRKKSYKDPFVWANENGRLL